MSARTRRQARKAPQKTPPAASAAPRRSLRLSVLLGLLILLVLTAVIFWNRRGSHFPAHRNFSLAQWQAQAVQNPDDEATWVAWAAAAGASGNDREAFGILAAFLKNHPQSAQAHLSLARLYQQKQAHVAAYSEALTAAKLDPKNADLWRLAGTEAQAQYQYAAAEAATRQAIALAPSDWRNQVSLGNTLSAANREAEAIPAYQRAVQLAPNEAIPALALGKALLDQATTPAQREIAQQELLHAVALRPDLALGDLYLGKCYMQEGRWPEARQALIQAEGLAPDNIAVSYNLAIVYRHLGDTQAVQRELNHHEQLMNYDLLKLKLKELTYQTDQPEILLKRARLLTAHGDYAQAADMYRGAIARAPSLKAAQRELAALEQKYPEGVQQTLSLPTP